MNTIQIQKIVKCKILILNIINLVNLLVNYKKLKRRKNRRWWVKPHLQIPIRDKYGAFSQLFVYFALHDHEEFHEFLHMNLENFINLFNLVKMQLQKKSRRKPLEPEMRLAIVLHFLAHGGCSRQESWLFRIGLSTMYALVSEVCKVLCKILIPRFVKFPDKQKWLQIARDYYNMWNFPNCIGALDGQHIEIENAPNAGGKFKNYKKFYSIVFMALCDAKRRFIWFNVGDYGSCSDSSVFSMSDLSRKLENNNANIPPPRTLPNSDVATTFVIVADEIFGLKNNVMKPFPRNNNLSMEEKIFNYRLSRARLSIECAFGIMHEKWEILQKPLAFALENCDIIVTAIVGLHNFILYSNDSVENENVLEDYEHQEIVFNGGTPIKIRNRLKEYFVSPEGSVPWQESYI